MSARTHHDNASGPVPPWAQQALYAGAVALARDLNRAATAVTFRLPHRSDLESVFSVRMDSDPASARFRLVLVHQASGEFACCSEWVAMDSIDPDRWNFDFGAPEFTAAFADEPQGSGAVFSGQGLAD